MHVWVRVSVREKLIDILLEHFKMTNSTPWHKRPKTLWTLDDGTAASEQLQDFATRLWFVESVEMTNVSANVLSVNLWCASFLLFLIELNFYCCSLLFIIIIIIIIIIISTPEKTHQLLLNDPQRGSGRHRRLPCKLIGKQLLQALCGRRYPWKRRRCGRRRRHRCWWRWGCECGKGDGSQVLLHKAH